MMMSNFRGGARRSPLSERSSRRLSPIHPRAKKSVDSRGFVRIQS